MTTTTDSKVMSRTRAALLILEHAERIGLPLPFTHTVADYLSPENAPVTFGFDRLDQVADWALWMETTIDTTTYLHETLSSP